MYITFQIIGFYILFYKLKLFITFANIIMNKKYNNN